jgi:hypothetical protein
VLAALAATTAGYLRGRLPGATSGVRLPAAAPEGPARAVSLPGDAADRSVAPAAPDEVRTGGA